MPPQLHRVLAPFVCVAVLSSTGCSVIESLRPEHIVRDSATDYAGALSTGHWAVVPYSDVPARESAEIIKEMDGIRPKVEVRSVTVEGKTAVARLAYAWPLRGETWAYETDLAYQKADGGWAPQWAPTVMHPELKAETRLVHTTITAPRARIMNAQGDVLAGPAEVTRLGLDRSQVADDQVESAARAIATALAINPETFAARAKSAGPKEFVEGLVVRGRGAAVAPAGFGALRGATAVPDTRVISRERGFAEELLGQVGPATAEDVQKSKGAIDADQMIGRSGLQRRYEADLAGTPGSRVKVTSRTTTDAVGVEIFSSQPTAGKDLVITLDPRLQTKAETVLEKVPSAASIAVVRPSTGEVLALANSPAANGSPDANMGHFPPGSTFKVVTSLALLRKGLDPDSPMTCNPTTKVAGREFRNYKDFPPTQNGPTTLRKAVAHSCNTALIDQHPKITGEGLRDAAGSLGVGIDYDLGYPVFLGSVPDPADPIDTGAAIIGQSRIEVSPLAMAGVAASVSAGSTVIPQLVRDKSVASTAKPLTPQEARQLQDILGAVTAEGSGAGLKDVAKGAKTGTAEYGTDTPLKTHAWMIAYGNDVAVAAFVKDGESGSKSAGPLARVMLEP